MVRDRHGRWDCVLGAPASGRAVSRWVCAGSLLDATNVVMTLVPSVITSLSLHHTAAGQYSSAKCAVRESTGISQTFRGVPVFLLRKKARRLAVIESFVCREEGTGRLLTLVAVRLWLLRARPDLDPRRYFSGSLAVGHAAPTWYQSFCSHSSRVGAVWIPLLEVRQSRSSTVGENERRCRGVGTLLAYATPDSFSRRVGGRAGNALYGWALGRCGSQGWRCSAASRWS